nr:MAG: hypothetical protein [Microvirus sp.]
MKKETLKNMRYSNMILKITVGMCSSYSIVTFRTASPGLPVTGCPTYTDVTLTNKDGSFKRFRSKTSLYSFLSEVFRWPIHPDLTSKDLLLTTVDLLII